MLQDSIICNMAFFSIHLKVFLLDLLDILGIKAGRICDKPITLLP